MDYNGSCGHFVVDFLVVLKKFDEIASLWFVLDFSGSFGLVIVDFASTEHFILNGLRLIGNGF